ncbi:hypothetical protein K432DRAFT_302028 [Lepidopterella palustris CBS 459.81]|uniref:Uncharacterized protein n=1 Tax=Lepidopterella palustris CBS 459.81 TaxID=1314670 RepID=A0A8E2E6R6_9PEZI|nr:hypothetical protein K432DRAFT_302028 [Lepidopterella palustris CBS 459.81]
MYWGLLFLLTLEAACNQYLPLSSRSVEATIAHLELSINSVPFSTHAFWMRQANAALAELASPCPFAAFGSVIANLTDTTGFGKLICIGINANSKEGNPTLHGELQQETRRWSLREGVSRRFGCGTLKGASIM